MKAGSSSVYILAAAAAADRHAVQLAQSVCRSVWATPSHAITVKVIKNRILLIINYKKSIEYALPYLCQGGV